MLRVSDPVERARSPRRPSVSPANATVSELSVPLRVGSRRGRPAVLIQCAAARPRCRRTGEPRACLGSQLISFCRDSRSSTSGRRTTSTIIGRSLPSVSRRPAGPTSMRGSLCPEAAVRAVPARLLLSCLLFRSSWLTVTVDGDRHFGAAGGAASPGRTGNRGGAGRRGWSRSGAQGMLGAVRPAALSAPSGSGRGPGRVVLGCPSSSFAQEILARAAADALPGMKHDAQRADRLQVAEDRRGEQARRTAAATCPPLAGPPKSGQAAPRGRCRNRGRPEVCSSASRPLLRFVLCGHLMERVDGSRSHRRSGPAASPFARTGAAAAEGRLHAGSREQMPDTGGAARYVYPPGSCWPESREPVGVPASAGPCFRLVVEARCRWWPGRARAGRRHRTASSPWRRSCRRSGSRR